VNNHPRLGASASLPRPAYGVLRTLLGVGSELRVTTDDDASSPTRLNQWREARERRVRGWKRHGNQCVNLYIQGLHPCREWGGFQGQDSQPHP